MASNRVNLTERKLHSRLKYLGLYYDFDVHTEQMYAAGRIHSILRDYGNGNYSVEEIMKFVNLSKSLYIYIITFSIKVLSLGDSAMQ